MMLVEVGECSDATLSQRGVDSGHRFYLHFHGFLFLHILYIIPIVHL